MNNDLNAASSGARLRSLVLKGLNPFQNKVLSAGLYLKKNQIKFNSKYALEAGRPAQYFQSQSSPENWADAMSVRELKARFFQATHYDRLALSPLLVASNADSERIHRGLREYLDAGAYDPDLNALLKKYLDGVVADPMEADVPTDLDLDLETNSVFIRAVDEEYDLTLVKERIDRMVQRVLVSSSQAVGSLSTGRYCPAALQ